MEHSIEAPEGGRIHRVRVLVDPGRKWKVAIKAAGPDTIQEWLDHDIGQASEQYPAHPESKPVEREFALVNFGKTILGEAALNWGMGNCRRNALPRELFAISEHHPNLDQELKTNGAMALLSLETCTMGMDVFNPVGGGLHRAEERAVQCICTVGWNRTRNKRYCKLEQFDDEFTDVCWFAFNVQPTK